jgi:hypothetical protein
MCRKLQEEFSKWGLTMNIAKTKYMSSGTDTNHLEMENGDIITGCTEFMYMGSIFTKDYVILIVIKIFLNKIP